MGKSENEVHNGSTNCETTAAAKDCDAGSPVPLFSFAIPSFMNQAHIDHTFYNHQRAPPLSLDRNFNSPDAYFLHSHISSTKTFSEVLAGSFLLRYHPQRSEMLQALQGGSTSLGAVPSPKVRNDLRIREIESQMFVGEGQLYFTDTLAPIPVPIQFIEPILIGKACSFFAVTASSGNRSEIISSLQRPWLLQRTAFTFALDQIQRAIDDRDVDRAMLLSRKMRISAQDCGLQQLQAVLLQLYLLLNDILVVEFISVSFHGALAHFETHHSLLQQSFHPCGEESEAVPPDISSVLELFSMSYFVAIPAVKPDDREEDVSSSTTSTTSAGSMSILETMTNVHNISLPKILSDQLDHNAATTSHLHEQGRSIGCVYRHLWDMLDYTLHVAEYHVLHGPLDQN